MKSLLVRLFVIAVLIDVSGCGTVASVTNAGKTSPIVYSGTRLDAAALGDDQDTLSKFDTEPPKYPGVDLIGSVILDTVLLPGTLVVAIFRKVAW